ncbi:MAG: hypothetical protein NTU61_02715 [Candidatus Altiarchaeota archaeon]|nr:hypothetical protein [Candidatus Altiarchaeota archaeon]
MGLMELEAKIRADGEREIQDLMDKAESQITAIRDEINRSAAKEAAKIVAQGQSTALISANKVLNEAKGSAVRRESAEKNAVIDRVFEKAKESVLSFPDSRKSELLTRLSHDPVFDGGEFQVLVDGKYRKLLKGAGGKVVESELGDFGVVIESMDGLIRVDNRLESVLSRMKPRMKPSIVKMIFGGAR